LTHRGMRGSVENTQNTQQSQDYVHDDSIH
jgi:hypothetical protein